MRVDQAISEWQSVRCRVNGKGLGHAGNTPLKRFLDGATGGSERVCGPSIPRHAAMANLIGYQACERALAALAADRRIVPLAEWILPLTETGRTKEQRARYCRVSRRTYYNTLDRFRDLVSDELQARSRRRRHQRDEDELHRMTLEQVAGELGVTRQRVQQIEASALKKCRAWCEANGVSLRDLIG